MAYSIKTEECDIRKAVRSDLTLRLRHKSAIIYPATLNPHLSISRSWLRNALPRHKRDWPVIHNGLTEFRPTRRWSGPSVPTYSMCLRGCNGEAKDYVGEMSSSRHYGIKRCLGKVTV